LLFAPISNLSTTAYKSYPRPS